MALKTPKKSAHSTKKGNTPFEAIVQKNKRALLIGSAVVIVAGILTAQALQKSTSTQSIVPTPIELPKELSMKNEVVSTQSATPTVASSSAQATQSATPTKVIAMTAKESTSSAKNVIKKLPNTDSENTYYTVLKGDSIARIGNRVCSDKQAWLYIAADNNLYYPYTLQKGETVVVNCR